MVLVNWMKRSISAGTTGPRQLILDSNSTDKIPGGAEDRRPFTSDVHRYCSVRMAIAKGSITNAKSKGESGQPCLVPRFKGKLEEDTPFVRTEQTGRTDSRRFASILARIFTSTFKRLIGL
ncbi:ubiquitin system component Cue domain containing [Labeo rohita]|uniref:Ubiquitin system component Cue domain containing n=1 Tax=Labeo rohita TaxID=84645 RepID=A0A498MLQ6_LABRO|nr:ubiquitin system component Cue domain containing [Labeo rohita]